MHNLVVRPANYFLHLRKQLRRMRGSVKALIGGFKANNRGPWADNFKLTVQTTSAIVVVTVIDDSPPPEVAYEEIPGIFRNKLNFER